MRYLSINILPERVILIFLFLILPHQAIAVDFNTKSLICHTKQFPVKGGFKFVNKQELIKYNILYDTSIKSEYLFSSKYSGHILTVDSENERLLFSGTGDSNNFYHRIEDYVGVKVTLISNGPNRSDLIHR